MTMQNFVVGQLAAWTCPSCPVGSICHWPDGVAACWRDLVETGTETPHAAIWRDTSVSAKTGIRAGNREFISNLVNAGPYIIPVIAPYN